MKRAISALLVFALLLTCCPIIPFEAKAATYSGTCGENLTWTLDEEGTLTISGTGAMSNYSLGGGAPWYDYLADIKSVTIESGVTTIGEFAFHVCFNLMSVTIPDSVTAIGEGAFSACASLTGIWADTNNPNYSSDE